ncbi:MAG: hypothetical protein HFG04_02695 [Oscillibacter sp.]|nr:hypothetical protein [Oscillibacter sp.]MCI9002195.1 hypothetical protein [Oscillibacter sp.]
MGEISRQLLVFGQSILLGLSAGLLYDLLRPFRVRAPRFTGVLDGLYSLTVGSAMFLFLLRRAEGELRGFVVLGAVGGAVLYFCAFSGILRPLWTFWADTLAFLARLLSLPLRWTRKFCKKMLRRAKNLFYFWRKCFTIRKSGHRPRREDGRYGKNKKGGKASRPHKPYDQALDRDSAGRAGLQGVYTSGAGVGRRGRKGPDRRPGGGQAPGE